MRLRRFESIFRSFHPKTRALFRDVMNIINVWPSSPSRQYICRYVPLYILCPDRWEYRCARAPYRHCYNTDRNNLMPYSQFLNQYCVETKTPMVTSYALSTVYSRIRPAVNNNRRSSNESVIRTPYTITTPSNR